MGAWYVTSRSIVEVGCVLLMVISPIALVYFSLEVRRVFMGRAVIHFLAITEIIPAIVILGLEQILDKASAGTLLAGVAGYVLGGMSENKPSGKPTGEGEPKIAGRGPRHSPSPEPGEPFDADDEGLSEAGEDRGRSAYRRRGRGARTGLAGAMAAAPSQNHDLD